MRRNYFALSGIDASNVVQTVSISASYASDAWSVGDADKYIVQIVFTGSSPTGTWALQSSVDAVTWFSVTTQAVSANGSILWENALCCAPYIRIIYTRTSGTGTATIQAFKKGTTD